MSKTIEVIITGHVCTFDEDDFNYLISLGPMSVCTKPDGYKTLVFSSGNYTSRYVHRVLMKAAADIEIDHKDGNTLNGIRSNLRLATSQQNKFNTSVRKNKRSGLPKGVCKHGSGYKAAITLNYRTTVLGTFKTPEEAESAYLEAAATYQKQFAVSNRKE